MKEKKEMRSQTASNLLDNAWVQRTGELRQLVSDQYDVTLGTPEEFVAWLMSPDVEEEFDTSDERALLRWAQRKLEEAR